MPAPYSLPSRFIARAPTEADAPKILEMINAYDLALLGVPDSDLEYILEDWRQPGFSLADDAQIVLMTDGQVIGYELMLYVHEDGAIASDGYVHPAYTNQGIGTFLLNRAEARARERLNELPKDVPARLKLTVFGHDKQSPPLFAAEGYHVVRHYWRMEIPLLEPPPPPILPEGVHIRTFVLRQDDHQTWETINAAFEEEWDFAPLSFEDWHQSRLSEPEFDPSLWWLAVCGEQIIGIALGNYRMEIGWLRSVGVRREWRRQGIGLALLHHAFGEFYRRGRANGWIGRRFTKSDGRDLLLRTGRNARRTSIRSIRKSAYSWLICRSTDIVFFCVLISTVYVSRSLLKGEAGHARFSGRRHCFQYCIEVFVAPSGQVHQEHRIARQGRRQTYRFGYCV